MLMSTGLLLWSNCRGCVWWIYGRGILLLKSLVLFVWKHAAFIFLRMHPSLRSIFFTAAFVFKSIRSIDVSFYDIVDSGVVPSWVYVSGPCLSGSHVSFLANSNSIFHEIGMNWYIDVAGYFISFHEVKASMLFLKWIDMAGVLFLSELTFNLSQANVRYHVPLVFALDV